MALSDKVAAARRIDELLKTMLKHGGFRLKYRITVDPPLPQDRDWERPEIMVELSGPDSSLLLERNAEGLRAFEHLSQQMLHLMGDEHEKIAFDAQGYRAIRLEELRTAAEVAAERVRKSGMPHEFGPMTSRERRVLHLALSWLITGVSVFVAAAIVPHVSVRTFRDALVAASTNSRSLV